MPYALAIVSLIGWGFQIWPGWVAALGCTPLAFPWLLVILLIGGPLLVAGVCALLVTPFALVAWLYDWWASTPGKHLRCSVKFTGVGDDAK